MPWMWDSEMPGEDFGRTSETWGYENFGNLEFDSAAYSLFEDRLTQFGPAAVRPGPDHDGDGDRDSFDEMYELPRVPGEEFPGSDAYELRGANLIWEMLEDLRELADDSPNNDSQFDGGNGSGNETPTPAPQP